MKNIIKTLIVMLTSISLFGSAQAGELGVSGTAKATYNLNSGGSNGKGLGITNELNFTASGELDNGYTWSYSMELDPGATSPATETSTGDTQSAQNDDTKLTMTTPYGTVGMFISEGGLDVEDSASQSAYSRPTDMGGNDGVQDNHNIDAYNNLQYHTPADMLPLGIMVKAAYAPDLDTYGSGNNTGAVKALSATYAGSSAAQYQVTAAPVDGLKVGASYIEFNDSGSGTGQEQEPESGAYYATYAFGNFTVGASQAYRAEAIDDDTQRTSGDVEYYDQKNMSVAMAVNDDLTVSYEVEESERVMSIDTEAATTAKSRGIQLAYNMGGMTIAVAHNEHENPSYIPEDSTKADETQTLIALTMAF
jgi:outer membrane protein OmpU